MARPDDDHECQPVTDEDGNVIASVHGSPGLLDDPAAAAAMADLIAAARRKWDADPERAAKDARQDAARRRNHERLVRLGIADDDTE